MNSCISFPLFLKEQGPIFFLMRQMKWWIQNLLSNTWMKPFWISFKLQNFVSTEARVSFAKRCWDKMSLQEVLWGNYKWLAMTSKYVFNVFHSLISSHLLIVIFPWRRKFFFSRKPLFLKMRAKGVWKKRHWFPSSLRQISPQGPRASNFEVREILLVRWIKVQMLPHCAEV